MVESYAGQSQLAQVVLPGRGLDCWALQGAVGIVTQLCAGVIQRRLFRSPRTQLVSQAHFSSIPTPCPNVQRQRRGCPVHAEGGFRQRLKQPQGTEAGRGPHQTETELQQSVWP